MQPVAVIGALGQLGSELCRQLGDRAVPLDLPELDITDADSVHRALAVVRPESIINCAAYTAVDLAEQQADTCHAINAAAVRHLAAAAEVLGCTLMHISTDYIFGGNTSRSTPYVETDNPSPQGVYAQAKYEGELFARQWASHFIVRTCGLYGISARGSNFVETMLRLGAERPMLRVVDDQHCTPTYTAHLARALLFLLSAPAPYGTYNVVNAGSTTWYRFAGEIFRLAGMDVQLQPITSAQYAAPAPRPCYSVLDTSKYAALAGPPLPPWQEALAEYLARRRAASTAASHP